MAECGQDGCGAHALRYVEGDDEPDGAALRCVGHSRTKRAEQSRRDAAVSGRGQRPRAPRSRPRVRGASSKSRGAPAQNLHEGQPPYEVDRPSAVWPEETNLEVVKGPGGQLEWRNALLRNLISGAIDEPYARTMTKILSDASLARPPTPGAGEGDEDDPMNVLRDMNAKLLG